MKLIVQEYVSRIAEPHKKVFSITADAIGSYNTIPLSIGLSKGDLIAFRGEGDPIRISSGGVDGRVLVVDSSTESGWKVAPMSGSDTAVTLHNGTGTIVPGGTVVKISSGDEMALATSSDTSMLFVTSEDCNDDADVVCYGTTNTICSVRCTSGAVAIGDKLKVSSTNGVAEATQGDGFAQALTAKASGSTGTVTAIFVQSGFLPLTGGTVTGNVGITGNLTFESSSVIKYHGNKSTNTMIEFLNNTTDTYGNGVAIGGGGATIIGGGEAATAAKGDVNAGDEKLILCNDGGIDIWTNCQSGTASATKRTIDNNGNFNGKAANVTGTVAIANGGTGATTAANARINLGAFSTSGGTLTGNWFIKNTGMDAAASSRSANQYSAQGIKDSNDRYVGYFQTAQYTDGSSTQQMAARHVVSGSNVDNILSLKVAANGTRSVVVSEAAPWRSALGLGSVATESTVPISKGGTGETTRLNALKALTNESVGTSAQFFLTITSSWGKGGYTNVADAKTVLGIADSGWVTLNSSIPTYYRRIGAIVNVIVPRKQVSNGSTTLGTLPSGYRPKGLFRQVIEVTSEIWSRQGLSYLEINTNGVVTLVNNGANNDYFSANVTFFTA